MAGSVQLLVWEAYGRRMRIADVLCTVGQRTCTQPLASGGRPTRCQAHSSYAAARRIGTSGSCLASLAGWLAGAAAPRTRPSTPPPAEQHHDTPSPACSAHTTHIVPFGPLQLALHLTFVAAPRCRPKAGHANPVSRLRIHRYMSAACCASSVRLL